MVAVVVGFGSISLSGRRLCEKVTYAPASVLSAAPSMERQPRTLGALRGRRDTPGSLLGCSCLYRCVGMGRFQSSNRVRGPNHQIEAGSRRSIFVKSHSAMMQSGRCVRCCVCVCVRLLSRPAGVGQDAHARRARTDAGLSSFSQGRIIMALRRPFLLLHASRPYPSSYCLLIQRSHHPIHHQHRAAGSTAYKERGRSKAATGGTAQPAPTAACGGATRRRSRSWGAATTVAAGPRSTRRGAACCTCP